VGTTSAGATGFSLGNKTRRVALDLAGTANTVGAPSFASFAKGEKHERRRNRVFSGIAGSYSDGGAVQPFVRDQFGNVTAFSVTGFQGVGGIEDNGNAEGLSQVTDSTTRRGWQRTSAGSISFFADPSAGSQGTYPSCVSGNGKVAGSYFDQEGNFHNFVKTN